VKEKEKFETLKDNLVEIIGELPLSVNIVAKEEELITKAQTNHFWSKIGDSDFDTLTEKLSPLMKYRDGKVNTTGPAALDLTDLVKTKETVEFGPEHESVSISRYKEMVEALILEMTESNPVLIKIKKGQAVSEEEAKELSDLLLEEHPHITEELLRNVYKNRKAKFLQFIRHILGLEVLESYPETVSRAFEQFIHEHTNLTSRQMDFLNLLKDFIIERENITRRNLIESPFTRIHPDGIRGLFTPTEISEILELTEKVAS
jgi:type I restriction enzyme R subunit